LQTTLQEQLAIITVNRLYIYIYITTSFLCLTLKQTSFWTFNLDLNNKKKKKKKPRLISYSSLTLSLPLCRTLSSLTLSVCSHLSLCATQSCQDQLIIANLPTTRVWEQRHEPGRHEPHQCRLRWDLSSYEYVFFYCFLDLNLYGWQSESLLYDRRSALDTSNKKAKKIYICCWLAVGEGSLLIFDNR
jgi:hypothetical protein